MKNEIFEQKEINNNFDNNHLLRSSEIHDLISNKKSFLSRWAIFLFFVIFSILLISTNFIHYPEIIKVRSKLIGFNAPKEIYSKKDGKIVRLFVKNNDYVFKGDMLMWIESNADHKEVLYLDKLLDSCIILLKKNKLDTENLFFTTNYFTQLGELQSNYEQFMKIYQNYSNSYFNGYSQKKIEYILSDINGIITSTNNLYKQKNIIEEDIRLINEGYVSNETLFKEKVISSQDLRIEKSKLLNKQLNIPQIDASIITNQAFIREKKREIFELGHIDLEQKLSFTQALFTLKNLVKKWKEEYIITAPIDGIVILSVPLQENHYVNNANILGFINPKYSKYYAEVILPQANFGKVQIGQNVQLRFDAYPYNEFGIVNGNFHFISTIASDSGFIAQVFLPDGLITTKNVQLQYSSGLLADALIITKDITIYQKFVYTILKNTER